MNYGGNQLSGLVRAVRQRRRLMLALRGLAMCLGVGAVILLLTGWAAHRYRHHNSILLILRISAALSFITTIYLFLVRPLLKRIGDARLARLIEERHPNLGDRLVTAIEFSAKSESHGASPAIINRLVADADHHAAAINLDSVIHRRKLLTYGMAAMACVLLFAGVLRWGPSTIFVGVTQLVTPTSLANSTDSLSIIVKPGSARVPRHSDQQIIATLANFNAETVTFFSRPVKAEREAEEAQTQWIGQAMEPAKAQRDFQFFIFNIQDSTEYFVESNNVRSEVFRLDVVDLPYVKQIDLALNFPAYTRIATKTIENGGEIAALKGTVARITARLTGKVKAARMVLRDGRKIEMRPDGETNFAAAVTVTGNTSYHIELVSVDGETYNGSNEYDITMLEDQPPTVSFEKPGRDTKATSIEEVFTQAKAEDDYGVTSIDLFFSVNGSPEQKVDLQKTSRDAGRILNGSHTFFLEEYGLKPGDVVSYYAKARDASSEVTSDIYFIEVKPFEMQFKQAQQQGGGGGGGGEDQNALTRRQKELIAATFRLIREGASYPAQERTDSYNTVTQGQERLRDDTLAFSARIRRRLVEGGGDNEILVKLIEHIALAAREMNQALDPLKKQAGKDALPAEQRALQHLLSADALFLETQVAFGNQEGGGGESREQAQELSDLFELELDKMKNQYETLRREQRQQSERGKYEIARKLEELARRQQQALEQQQRRQQGQPRNGSSSGGGGSQRQQQELIDETRRAARELERLSRERRDQQLQELSRQLNQAADEMQRAQASSTNSNQSESTAQAQRALERLEQARRRLQGSNQAGRTQELSELRQRAADAAARQREITKDVESLARQNGQNSQGTSARDAKQRLAERKGALAESLNNLEQDIEKAARSLGGQQQQRAGQQLRDAAAALRRNRVSDRIRQNNQNIENNQYEAARAGERAVQQSLNELTERLQSAEQSAGRSAGSDSDEALDRARQLADNLESLRRRMNENGNQRNQRGESQQGNRQSGQQQQQGDQRGQSESSQGGQQDGQSTTRSGRYSQTGGRYYRDGVWGSYYEENKQIGSELRERLRDAEELRRQLGRTGADLTRGLDEAIAQLQRLTRDAQMQGEAQTAALLKAQVIDPLRQIELELSKRLQARLGHSNLRLGDEGNAPERYRKSVDEYYKRLSNRALVR